MFDKWFAISETQMAGILTSALVAYAGVLVITRIFGLRSFSKMSAADFAMTIACGSILGATVSAPTPTAFVGLFALLCLFLIQWGIAFTRRRSERFGRIVDNQPILLMAGDQILHGNLDKANLSENDLMGKLREANAFCFDQVLAVVFETTGDISVLHSDEGGAIDPMLLRNVVDADVLRDAGDRGQSESSASDRGPTGLETKFMCRWHEG